MKIKGSSTGLDPIQVSKKKFAIKAQYSNLPKGLKFNDFSQLIWTKGVINKINILKARPRTPPNLLGMALSIAYANKKYHSGIIWTGVTKEFVFIKFSGSPKRFELKNTKYNKNIINKRNP